MQTLPDLLTLWVMALTATVAVAHMITGEPFKPLFIRWGRRYLEWTVKLAAVAITLAVMFIRGGIALLRYWESNHKGK